MIVKTFGNIDKPTIVLLHGGGLSWWSWTPVIEHIKDNYNIIVPVLKGHGENFMDEFISIEDQSTEIIKYINQNHNCHVHAIAGLSIGAQILCEIISTAPDICEKAIIESALLYPLPSMKIMTKLLYRLLYPLTKQKWFAKAQAKSLSLPDEMISLYYEDSSKMTYNSLVNMTLSNSSYRIKDNIDNSNASVSIIVGEKELGIMKKSAFLLHDKIRRSDIHIAPSLKHGEFSICHPNEFINHTGLLKTRA